MQKPLKECRTIGCHALTKEVRCIKCQRTGMKGKESTYKRESWKVKFYNNRKWRNCSKAYRLANPLCACCQSKGIVKQIVDGRQGVVHHDPPLEELLTKGLDPYNWKYLKGLCNDCHKEEHIATNEKTKKTKKIAQGQGVPENIKRYL